MNHVRCCVTYTATPDVVGYGWTVITVHAAALLVKPGLNRETLSRCLVKLQDFILHVEDWGRRSSADGHPSGERASFGSTGRTTAIGWSPEAPDIRASKCQAPWFSGRPDGLLAFTVDDQLSRSEAVAALLRLKEHAMAPDSDFLEPLPVRRVLHEMGEVIGYAHDGTPMRAAGSTRVE